MTDLWTGEFGDAYTARQPSNIEDRTAFWRAIMPENLTSILEVGANTGMNLEAIRSFSSADLFASEPNESACKALKSEVVCRQEYADAMEWADDRFDLVLTCGVLIHIPTDKLLASMKEIHRVSRQWIICAEYFAPSEEMIPYRGTKDTLWRRDYGSIWMDNFPDLTCEGCIFAWKRITGMDNLAVWIFEKGGS
jgi:pseudaminic acid biosynthesis-associated methylase